MDDRTKTTTDYLEAITARLSHANHLPSALHKLYKWAKMRKRIFTPDFGSLAKRKEELKVS